MFANTTIYYAYERMPMILKNDSNGIVIGPIKINFDTHDTRL